MRIREVLAASSTVFLVLVAVGLALDKYPPYVLLVSLLCATAVVGIAGLATVLRPVDARPGPDLPAAPGGGPAVSDAGRGVQRQ